MTRGYKKWLAMRKRWPLDVCPAWTEPGGRGFRQFVDDLGEPPANHTLLRRDESAPFNPANCYYAPWAGQKRGGPPVNPESVRQRALAAGLLPQTVWQRMRRLGWSTRKALATPTETAKLKPNL